MRWLITVPAGTDLGDLGRALGPVEGSLRDVDPVPLGEEMVVFAEGPSDLPQRLERAALSLRLNPDSEPEPY